MNIIWKRPKFDSLQTDIKQSTYVYKYTMMYQTQQNFFMFIYYFIYFHLLLHNKNLLCLTDTSLYIMFIGPCIIVIAEE